MVSLGRRLGGVIREEAGWCQGRRLGGVVRDEDGWCH